jgi:hypothetical protein
MITYILFYAQGSMVPAFSKEEIARQIEMFGSSEAGVWSDTFEVSAKEPLMVTSDYDLLMAVRDAIHPILNRETETLKIEWREKPQKSLEKLTIE